MAVLAVVTLSQLAELLHAEWPGRCFGYPPVGHGAQVGGAPAAFEQCALAHYCPRPDLPHHFVVHPDLEVAVQDYRYRRSFLRLTEQEFPGIDIADSRALPALHDLLRQRALEFGLRWRDNGSLVLAAPGGMGAEDGA